MVTLLAAVGSVDTGFAVLTDCTDRYSCSSESCSPCAATGAWLNGGLITQAVLMVVSLALIVMSLRGWWRKRAVTACALVVLLISVGTVARTGWAASRSFCQPGGPPGVGGGPNYCDT